MRAGEQWRRVSRLYVRPGKGAQGAAQGGTAPVAACWARHGQVWWICEARVAEGVRLCCGAVGATWWSGLVVMEHGCFFNLLSPSSGGRAWCAYGAWLRLGSEVVLGLGLQTTRHLPAWCFARHGGFCCVRWLSFRWTVDRFDGWCFRWPAAVSARCGWLLRRWGFFDCELARRWCLVDLSMAVRVDVWELG